MIGSLVRPTAVDDPWAAYDEEQAMRRASEPYRGVSIDPGLRRAPGDTTMLPPAQTFGDVVGDLVIPQKPSDFAMYALGGPFSRAAKLGALVAGFGLDSDEAQAGKGNLVRRATEAAIRAGGYKQAPEVGEELLAIHNTRSDRLAKAVREAARREALQDYRHLFFSAPAAGIGMGALAAQDSYEPYP